MPGNTNDPTHILLEVNDDLNNDLKLNEAIVLIVEVAEKSVHLELTFPQ